MVWAKSATSMMFEVSMGTQSASSHATVAGQYLRHQRALADPRQGINASPLPTTRTFMGSSKTTKRPQFWHVKEFLSMSRPVAAGWPVLSLPAVATSP
jgi:hypothetical protein